MECPHKECASSEDCAIIDITKKVPKKKESCSYYSKKKSEPKTTVKKEI
jgi:hypothetical protein